MSRYVFSGFFFKFDLLEIWSRIPQISYLYTWFAYYFAYFQCKHKNVYFKEYKEIKSR